MISPAIYLLCALTSTACALLLHRTYRQNRTRLLLWSGICFFCLAVNNCLLFVDLVLVPGVDLSIVRDLPALIGFAALLWGFVWEAP